MITLTYRIAQFLSFIYLKAFHRFEVTGLGNIPKDGSFIMASNHMSFIDPPALGCLVNRNLHYFARDSLFVGPLGFLIQRLNAIPVNRGQLDLKTLKLTLSVLKRGNPLLVFPEGTRSTDGRVGKAKKGIGLLVSKAKCDVLPVRIAGSFEILGKGRLIPRFGKKLSINYGELIPYGSLPFSEDEKPHQLISDFVIKKISEL